jgi:DNA replication initiation complex subunit (GINS family)
MATQDRINISYETLFDILRAEKSKEELSELSKDFFKDLVEYLRIKRTEIEDIEKKNPSSPELNRLRTQFHNIQRIVTEIYNRREKKILINALNNARVNSRPKAYLLDEEKKFFDELVEIIKTFREGILNNLLSNKLPKIELKKHIPQVEQGKSSIAVRFLGNIPKIVDLEGNLHGPFSEDEIATVPFAIAKVLIEKGRAEEIKF